VNRPCWGLIDFLSLALAPDERDAVLGDLAESGDSGVPALSAVLGLVARRQSALWQDWRPWLGLFGLAVPLGLLLSFNAFVLDRAVDLYLWILRNHATIDPRTLEETGLTLRHGMVQFIVAPLLLISWSWISGFVLGTLSRRRMWVNGVAFCLTLASAAFTEMSRSRPYQYSVAGWVFPVTFYTAILPLPLLLVAVLVLLPALRGLYQSRRLAVPELRMTILWTALIVVLAAGMQPWAWKLPAFAGLLVLAGYWPVGYLVVMSFSKEKLIHENFGH
jgi:hypothetical protein